MLATHPPTPSPTAAAPGEETVPLLDIFVLCVTTYLTYTRFPANWKRILCNFYIFFITTWAYAEAHGMLRPDVSLRLRYLNANLCFVNLLLDANGVRFRGG